MRTGSSAYQKKSVLHAVPVYTAGQRLPLEGKLAAQPTDEVANKNWEKEEASIKDAGFPPHPPSVRTGHLPLKGEGLNTFLFGIAFFA